MMHFAALLLGASAVYAQSRTERVIPTISPQVDAAPSLTPTVLDPTAPDAQKCPGYKASGVQYTSNGFTADLTLAGPACQAYGNDIVALTLDVAYQTAERLSVRIAPKYLDAANATQYLLPADLVQQPEWDGHTTNATSDLALEWSNDPSFQFRVRRKKNGDELFSTFGHVIVFEDQFLELVTTMPEDYTLHGLPENIRDWLLGTNATQTFYATDSGNTVDGNVYGTYPFYTETRYGADNGKTAVHGVYARNAHGQEWLLRESSVTYRTIGGTFDLYFLSGQDSQGHSSALETIRQFQAGCVGLPVMQQYWAFGFHQCRWGYENISVCEDVVQGYRDANIPLECMWNDIDIYDLYRDFTLDPNTYPASGMKQYIDMLHSREMHYVPIVDSNTYAPNPDNTSDAYPPWSRGAALGTYIRDPTTGDFYFGDNWPGFSSWADWLVPSSQAWWTYELQQWFQEVAFDGIWIDLSEASSFCVGSCGNGRLTENPVHPPFLLPNDPYQANYHYPAGFNVTNATEYASAMSASASQASVLSTLTLLPVPTTTTQGRTIPTPGVRNLNFPPYVLNTVQAGHSLLKGAIAPNATHNDPHNTTEYAMHNLFGYQISNATYHALLAVHPGKRPFTIGRSTFAGSGKTTGHWGGDNTSTWGSMFLSISQALTFMMAGMPMFGADTCGFSENTDFELCSRWMSLSAFTPFYRNHNVKSTISQEAYRWSSVAEASRRAMAVRYSLLNYMYTLFYYAHTQGDTVMRALAWEFPEDKSLRGTFNQFMLGPSLLITPVLEPNVDTVRGVFPDIGQGERWYDWYTLDEVQARAGENVTLAAPLEHINVHVRGGAILPLQEPALTTAATRRSPFGLLVVLDAQDRAQGSLYLDDGESLAPNATKLVTFSYADDELRATVAGNYSEGVPLANVTIAGVKRMPRGIELHIGDEPCQVGTVILTLAGEVLRITGLADFFAAGAWAGDVTLRLLF